MNEDENAIFNLKMTFEPDEAPNDIDYVEKFNWNPAQALLYYVDPKETECVVLAGDTRSGKTFVAGQYAADMCLDFPGIKIAVLGPIKEQTMDTIWRSIKHGLARIGLKYNLIETQAKVYLKTRNGSEIHLAPYEGRGVDRVMGREYGAIIVDESHLLSKQKYANLVTRLSGYGPRMIILIVNPQGPLHYIKTDLIDKAEENKLKNDNSIVYIYYSVYENKDNLPAGYIERLERLLPHNEILRLMRGEWINPAGAVFYNLSETDIVEPFEVDVYAAFGGVDFGFDHPFAYAKIVLSWDGIFYLVAEHREKGMSLARHASAIENIDGDDFPSIKRSADHDAQDVIELELLGISTTNAKKKDKTANIKGLNRLIDLGIFKIFSSCVLSKNELFNYQWKENSHEPVKQKDDLVDAILYCITGALDDFNIREFIDKKIRERGERLEHLEEKQVGFFKDSRNYNGKGIIFKSNNSGGQGLDNI